MPEESRNQRLYRLFEAAMEAGADERAALLAEVEHDDADLAHELRAMLDVSEQRLHGFLDRPVVDSPPAPPTTPQHAPTIAGYEDLQLVGEGGMGAVYRARQLFPVRRVVAIKTIRPGFASARELARFAAERQALARMAHPGIATVHDAGTDDRGAPYLVMEFVDGPPLTQYCTDQSLDLEARLLLLIKVCDAVEHAHRRGVLHRDLKPSNVLVATIDGVAQPKVIDFGIAKALEDPLGGASMHTLHGTLLGTPDYMSPEQIAGERERIDTRADVYGLGVLLYELLTGQRPFDSARLQREGLTAWIRIVQQEPAPRPSVRLGQLAGTQNVETAWMRRLHGDLDWVAMKALEKDPERRYPSPRELADDLRRFLERLPVEAGPPSGLYRARRFLRRHRGWVASIAAIITVLSIGVIALSIQSANNRQLAEHAQLARNDAERANDTLRSSLYRSQMRLATETIDTDGGLGRIRDVVAAWRPKPGEPDLRGFEWRLLAAMLDTEQHVVPFDGTVREVAWHPGGRLATTHNNWLITWDEQSVQPTARWEAEGARVSIVAISRDGRRVVRATQPGSVTLFDVETGAALRSFAVRGHPRRYCLSADGGLLYLQTDAMGTVLLDTATGEALRVIEEGTQCGGTLSPDGSVFAVGLRSSSSRLLVFRSDAPEQPFREFEGRFGSAQQVAIDADNRRIASVDGLWLQVWSLETGELLLEHEHTNFLSCVALDPGGHHCTVGSTNFVVYVHDLATRTLRKLRGHDEHIPGVAMSPDGRRVASVSWDQTMRIWTTASEGPRRERVILATTWLNRAQLTFDTTGDALQLHTGNGDTIWWNFERDELRRGSLIGDHDARLRRWHESRSAAAQSTAFRIATVDARSGSLAVLQGQGENKLWVWLDDAEQPQQSDAPFDVTGAAWMTGHRLAINSSGGQFSIIDARTGAYSPPEARQGLIALAAHPTRDLLAMGDNDTAVRLLCPTTGELTLLKGHTGYVDALQFSPDGTRLATGGRDRVLRLWDIDAGAEVAGLRVPQRIANIVFRRDGDRLAMVGRNGLAIVWDVGKARLDGAPPAPAATPNGR